MSNRIVWVDLETTGLDPEYDVPLEIAVVVTDFAELKAINSFSVPIKPAKLEPFASMVEEVNTMHRVTGLLGRLDQPIAQTVEEAERRALQCIFSTVGQPPLGGSSVHFDRSFLRKWMPTFHARLSHRNIDVSTVRQLVQNWYPDVKPFDQLHKPKHTATADVKNSIAELSYYRSQVFVGEPWGMPSPQSLAVPVVRINRWTHAGKTWDLDKPVRDSDGDTWYWITSPIVGQDPRLSMRKYCPYDRSTSFETAATYGPLVQESE